MIDSPDSLNVAIPHISLAPMDKVWLEHQHKEAPQDY